MMPPRTGFGNGLAVVAIAIATVPSDIVLDPLDLMARLAALVPPPRVHLMRYHGVFAPHSRLRAAVTRAHRGVEAPKQARPIPAAG